MPRHLRLAITLAIAAGGLRIGEVCGLQRQDIDLDRRTITIRRTRLAEKRSIAGDPKTPASRRTEPLPESVIPEIKAHLDRWVQDKPDAWIFRGRISIIHDRNSPIALSSMRSDFIAARHKAGRDDLRFHDLRVTALTMLAQQGRHRPRTHGRRRTHHTNMAIHYQRTTEKRQRALADKGGRHARSVQGVEGVRA